MLTITLDTHVRVPITGSPPRVLAQIQSALRIPNPARKTAIKEKLWSAKTMPEHIDLWRIEGDDLVLPRGFYASLAQGMQTSGVEVDWVDERRWYNFFPLNADPIKLRDYQRPAVEALVTYEQGILSGATGAGKTAMMLEAARRVDQPTLIIVDKAALAEQWIEQIQSKLGIEAGYVGEDRIDVRPATVCLRQAVWARWETLERPEWDLLGIVTGSFFDLWGTVVWDEQHHVSSSGTAQEILSAISARYRWGASATPDRDKDWFPVSMAIIGPILHEVTAEDAGDSLVKPSVRVLTSGFDFDYHPTYFDDKVDPETGAKIISTRTGKPVQVRVQNNYADMMKALCSDPARNRMIAEEIVGEMMGGHKVLVVSRRKQHLKEILVAIEDVSSEAAASTVLLTGENSGQDARDLALVIEKAPYICVLSTIADEGLSFDSLDRVVLAYPARNPETVKQVIGRIMRPADGKTDAIVIDVRDSCVGLLRSQYRDRSQLLYSKSGYRIDIAEAVEI